MFNQFNEFYTVLQPDSLMTNQSDLSCLYDDVDRVGWYSLWGWRLWCKTLKIYKSRCNDYGKSTAYNLRLEMQECGDRKNSSETESNIKK